MRLNEITKECYKIAQKRIENGSTMTKDNLKHCAEEVIESVEARTIYNAVGDSTVPEYLQELRDNFEDELMDVIVCVLIECGKYDIDVEKALERCMDKNKKRALCIGDKL